MKTMSNNMTTSLQEQEKINKKSLHQMNDSGELDVFEAARYFSGANEISGGNSAQKMSNMKDDHQPRLQQGGRRMSLDIPSLRNSIPSQSCQAVLSEKSNIKEKKYHKQPSSPGGKLASFLNSLFNQTISSKKKKSKSTISTTQSMKDEEESPGGGRRKRRSSISHFRSAKSHDTKSMYSTSSTTTTTTSGFRTPPPYGYMIPTKTCKDLRSSHSDHKPILTNINVSKSTNVAGKVKDQVTDYSWLDEKFKFRDIGFLEKHKINNLGNNNNNNNNNGFLEKGRIWGDQEKENVKRFMCEEDEGGDSDSSSDLFELRNCDLGYYSSGLPVYETTHMDSIKRGAPISTGGPN